MSAIEIRILPDAALLPSVLSAVKVYAKQFFKSKKEYDRIVLSVEEAVDNVLNYSVTGQMTDITVTVDSNDGEFTVCVLDRGLPGNYEETLKGEERLGLTIMQNSVDVVRVENLGAQGRRQTLIKYYAAMPDFADKSKRPDKTPIENAEISVRTPKREDMLEVCRIFYEEYGLTYLNEIVYYPDRFYAAVRKDQLHSTVAVDQDGNIAGHHACFEWENIPGIWESGMAVVNGRYRNAGIFGKMMARTYSYVHDEVRGKLFLGCCITAHAYSQKLRLSYGSFPCGFRFNLVPPDVITGSFIKEGHFAHEAYAATPFDFPERSVYLPEEIVRPAQFIFDGMKLPRTIRTDEPEPEEELTRSDWSYEKHLRNGTINVHVTGRDCAGCLSRDTLELRTRGAEMITLNANACDPGFIRLYEAAKSEGFFFTALLPNADVGDYVVMQKLFRKAVDYDDMVTVGPFTELLNVVRSLDPDQQKQKKAPEA